jgi:hypothetical protein
MLEINNLGTGREQLIFVRHIEDYFNFPGWDESIDDFLKRE